MTIELKSTVKEFTVSTAEGDEVTITTTYDREFKVWSAYTNLSIADAPTAEQAAYALVKPAHALLKALGQAPPKLIVRQAFTPADKEAMRQIRNSCREFMTNSQAEISPAQQDEWWENIKHYKNAITPLLAFIPDRAYFKDEAIGYGISRVDTSGGRVITGGLLPEFRGQGFGEPLFRELLRWTGIPCHLDVRLTNLPAKKLYAKLGFKTTFVDNEHGIESMTLTHPPTE